MAPWQWFTLRRASKTAPLPKSMLVIPGPSITADDWDGPNLKPGVIDRFETDLAALIDRLRSL